MENDVIEIAGDLQAYIDKYIESVAESHLEAWKERYFGYTKERLEYDLSVNHDDSLEIESAEYELKRELTEDEKTYLTQKFHEEVVKQYVKY